MNTLEALGQYTTLVADTGEFKWLKHYPLRDATTNPSLILKAVRQREYLPLLLQTLKERPVDQILDYLLVRFGWEILTMIPGRVSTEIDARLSSDTAATIAKAKALVALYQTFGIARDRVLIKIASTWEGIRAAEILERSGIHCNMTLIFSLVQAAACADAGATVISPFVGRVGDWVKKHADPAGVSQEGPSAFFSEVAGGASPQTGQGERQRDTGQAAAKGSRDPGVQLVRQIYAYCKQQGYAVQVMGASFRTTAQILELAGCDLLTISLPLLRQLQNSTEAVERKLSPETLEDETIEPLKIDQPFFLDQIHRNAMAIELLEAGIRQFIDDTLELETLIERYR